MEIVECQIRVRYSEVSRQGYAYHANYLNWFDIAQEQLVENCGISYRDIEDLGFFLATVDDHCTYIHPAYYNDVLTIRLSVSDLSAVKIKFIYEIVCERDARLVAMGQSTHVFVDNQFRPHSLRKIVPSLYEKIEAMLQR